MEVKTCMRYFLEKAGENAAYTSKDAVVDFVETIGLWVEECLLKRLCQTHYLSLLADVCTDISTIEELSIFCHWVDDGLPVEHFIELVQLKKTDANIIYETLIDCLKKKGLMISNMIGMGFDFFWQTQLKRNSPHSFLYTVTAIFYNLLVFKMLKVPNVSNIFTPHPLHYESTFIIIRQNTVNVFGKSNKY